MCKQAKKQGKKIKKLRRQLKEMKKKMYCLTVPCETQKRVKNFIKIRQERDDAFENRGTVQTDMHGEPMIEPVKSPKAPRKPKTTQ